ncbi:hypothetical protein SAMN05421874_12836 [Nonomuraea maritima]|uniref:Uncharacterized protein n=1 Tax=Nonomuraea maritima TaxID=683260 RepID=A0A1G9MHF0_9ACTN|nr:hypothetical protein [Nonomuraea maritima]SDL73554.1 hypothetical protein SAMN05421874_12836 [Nonomuraea maritima]
MADFTFNIALGRITELHNRVRANDPSGCALLVVALAAAGIESDADLKDKATLFDVLSGTTNEVPTGNGYARKVLVAADLSPAVVDNTNDLVNVDIPDQTWTQVLAASGAWAKLVICYRPSASSTDSQIVPLTCHDFAITPDGTDVVAQIAASGFFRAQ